MLNLNLTKFNLTKMGKMHVIWSLNLVLLIEIVFVFCLCSLVSTQESSSDNDPTCTISTNSGQIRGKLNRTLFDELPYYSFRGIPYAKPPIGDLRFKAPQKIEPWDRTLDAFDFGNDCVQTNDDNDIIGTEDCLFLNVYVPNKCSLINSNTKMPVVYYIFGGQFLMGSASFYGPEFLLETNVIIVSVNYRVGPIGFLSLNEPELSGNMALKDQLLGLQWVNENIGRFGGDVNNITLFGHSSGSSSINLMMLSPQAKNLFQKAIMMSGSSLHPFIPRRQDHTSILYNLAEFSHYPINNKSELIKFLNQIDGIQLYKKLYQQVYVPGFSRKSFSRIYAPCIEDENAVQPFLTQAPFDIVTDEKYQNHFDTLYCSSTVEVALPDEGKNPALLRLFDEQFEIQLPLEFANIDFNSKEYKNISTRMRDFYFDGKHIDADTLDDLNLLMSDIKFLYGIHLNARIQAAKSTGQTYYATFTAVSDFSNSERQAAATNFTVSYPTHSDQLYYLFVFTGRNVISEEDYQHLSKDSLAGQINRNITNFYMNFAKYGNPMPESEPVYFKTSGSNNFKFYNVTNDGVMKQENPIQDRIQFWNNIFNDFKHLWNTTFDFDL